MEGVRPARKATYLTLVLIVGLCGVFLRLRASLAEERIPALAFIPNNLDSAEKTKFSARRQELQAQLQAFQALAKAFNDQSSESQTDADFNSLQAQRAAYIQAANAFNRDLAMAKIAADPRDALPVMHVHASGEFYFITKDGHRVTGAEAATLKIDGGTRAVTGPNGRIQLQLPDETIFTLGPDSDMVLDDFVYDPATSSTRADAKFAKGTFRWVTGKVKEKAIKIELLIINIGIRGTDFEAMVKPGGAGYVKLFEGQVDITEKKTGTELTLKAGQMIRFTADGTLDQPTALPP